MLRYEKTESPIRRRLLLIEAGGASGVSGAASVVLTGSFLRAHGDLGDDTTVPPGHD
ncbi:hypothetical protein GCM10009626_19950 [Brachybacterium sacelli]